MILYHGTTKIINHPDVSFSKSYLDFGKGFYLTSYQRQAEKWALQELRYYKMNNQICIINQNVLNEKLIYPEII